VEKRYFDFDDRILYDVLEKIFMDALLSDIAIYNEYYALFIALCNKSCHKSMSRGFSKKIELFS